MIRFVVLGCRLVAYCLVSQSDPAVMEYICNVCIEAALCGFPMEGGVQLGLGEGPMKSGSNVSNLWVPSVPCHAS